MDAVAVGGNKRVVTLLHKQAEFVRSCAERVIYSGAFGAGKSFAIAAKCLRRASHPNAREGLCRKHRVQLKQTTLKTLIEGDGDYPPLLPMGTYDHNKTEGIIKIHGGGEILYFGMDEVSGTGQSKIGSYNLTGCGIDEWVELTENDTIYLDGRARVQVKGLVNQLYGGCNPGQPSHYLARDFGLALGHKGVEQYHAIRTKTSDNTHLPQSYIDRMSRMTGIAYKRFFLGEWVGSEGAVYDTWDRNTHVKESDGAAVQRRIIGVDDGYTNPFAVVVCDVDGDGRVHVSDEYYKRNMSVNQKVDTVLRLSGEATECVVVDPSAAQLIAELRGAGIHTVGERRGVLDRGTGKRETPVFSGIMRVHQRLRVAGDGEPRLTVSPSCEELIREFESYEWKENRQATGTDKLKDEPVKEHDHALDALRYVITYIDRGSEVAVFKAGGQEEARREQTTTLAEDFVEARKDPNWGF